jgi:hypothetical protein
MSQDGEDSYTEIALEALGCDEDVAVENCWEISPLIAFGIAGTFTDEHG